MGSGGAANAPSRNVATGKCQMCTSGSGGAAESPSRNVAEGTFGGTVPVRPEEGVMDVEEEAHETDEEDAETLQLQVEVPTRVKGGGRPGSEAAG